MIDLILLKQETNIKTKNVRILRQSKLWIGPLHGSGVKLKKKKKENRHQHQEVKQYQYKIELLHQELHQSSLEERLNVELDDVNYIHT